MLNMVLVVNGKCGDPGNEATKMAASTSLGQLSLSVWNIEASVFMRLPVYFR